MIKPFKEAVSIVRYSLFLFGQGNGESLRLCNSQSNYFTFETTSLNLLIVFNTTYYPFHLAGYLRN